MPTKQKKQRPAPKAIRPPAASSLKTVSFAGGLQQLIKDLKPAARSTTFQGAPLAHLHYDKELEIKNAGLHLFWQRHKLPGKPEPVAPSPKPRGYRTTSKRRTVLQRGALYLRFGDKGGAKQQQAFLASPLEPPAHERIYRFLQQKLSEQTYRQLANHLNYLIIRGSYKERAVIFNVDTLNGPLVRKLKVLAGHLQKLPDKITAAYVYPDPSRSDYYLESRRPEHLLHFKKLYGPDQLMVSYGECCYRFHPTSFSQINEAMVPVMLDMARELLRPQKQERLIDLYCGYGLFSHFLASHYKQVIGIDAEGPSIRAAAANSSLNKDRDRTKFLARRITGDMLDEVLPVSVAPEAVLLDPPRQGPQPGVIKALARRRPQKVLHIFCGVDQIPIALNEWQAGGYQVQRTVPLDMFPGSANLEVLILLLPSGAGTASAEKSGMVRGEKRRLSP